MKILLKENEIAKIVDKISNELSLLIAKEKKTPVIIGILKGGIFFAIDIIKKIKSDVLIDFIKISSYVKTTAGQITLKNDTNLKIKNRLLIIIEDIIDTGHSIAYLLNFMRQKHQPKKIITVALIYKNNKEHQLTKKKIKIDFIGKTINDQGFLIGYGLDYNEIGRNLKNVYVINKKDLLKLQHKG